MILFMQRALPPAQGLWSPTGGKVERGVTNMLRPLSTIVFAASLFAAALALPAQAPAKDGDAVQAPAASSSAVTSRAQAATTPVKRVRRASMQPRRVAVATPAAY